jgi:hypothetical protein
MKPTRIYFQKNFPTAQFQHENYGVEIELEQGDSVEQAFKEARNICFNQFQKDNPQITWNEQERDIPIIETIRHLNNINPPAQSYNPIEIPETLVNKTIEEQIQSCTSIEGENQLKSFEIFASMNKKYKPFYDKKLKELQQ